MGKKYQMLQKLSLAFLLFFRNAFFDISDIAVDVIKIINAWIIFVIFQEQTHDFFSQQAFSPLFENFYHSYIFKVNNI